MAFKCGLFDSTEVVETVGGFPRGNKAQDAEFFAKYFSSFIGNGVHASPASSFKVCPDYGMTVEICPGRAFINGFFCYDNNSDWHTFPVLADEHKYVLLLRLRIDEGDIIKVWEEDQPDGVLPRRTSNFYDLMIATVTVPAGASVIKENMIEDHRGDSGVCGYISSIVEKLGSNVDFATNSYSSVNAEHAEYSDEAAKASGLVSGFILPVSQGGTGVTSKSGIFNLISGHTQNPSTILSGTFGGRVLAMQESQETSCLRNFALSSTAGTAPANGSFLAVYN